MSAKEVKILLTILGVLFFISFIGGAFDDKPEAEQDTITEIDTTKEPESEVVSIPFDTKPTEEDLQGQEVIAYIMAEDVVRKNLISPSTAEFPSVSEKYDHVAYIGGGVYYIYSWVDSQNGFGAMLRTKFGCTMIYDGEFWLSSDLTFYK